MVAKIQKTKRGSYQTIFFSVLIGIFLFGVIGFLITSNLRINQKRAEMIEKIESLEKEIQVLEEKKEQLQAGIIKTETETYWEEKAREQGYKKPGEEQIVVLPPEEGAEESVEKEESFGETILEWFKSFGETILEKLGF